MKKATISFLLICIVMTLCSCGDSNIAENNSSAVDITTKDLIISCTDDNAENDENITYLYPYVEEEMPIEFFEPNGDGTLPFDFDYETGVCVIHDSEDIIFMFEDPWMEKAIKVSEGEYLFSNCCGHGTGCQMEELYRLQAPDYVPVKVLSYESIVDALNSRINYKYDEKYDVILFEWGEDQMKRKDIILSSYLKEHESEFEAFGWGDIVRIEFYEGRPWIYALGSMMTKPYSLWFDYTAGVTAPISLDDYSIGDINLFVLDNSVTNHHDDIKKSLENEIPFFYCYRDVNHNGCKDKIILSAEIIQGEYSGSFDDVMQKSMEVSMSNARVFDGSYIYTDPGQQSFNGFASFTYEFSAAHAGNGQLFVTTVDGADYLVETSLWSGQGETSYRYKVFFGDWQSEFIVEEKYVSFEYGNPPDNIDEFWDGLYKWINDSSILLIATDIDSEPMTYYSTTEKVVNPAVFYNKKREG